MVNYLPSNILHHKLDATNYLQSKDPNQLMHTVYGDATSTIITSSSSSLQNSLPLLTPLKYVEYVGAVSEEHMIITNDDSDGDCDSINDLHKTPLKNVKRNLPHKKRIAKKLNSNQSYNHQEPFSIIMPAAESSLRSMQTPNVRIS